MFSTIAPAVHNNGARQAFKLIHIAPSSDATAHYPSRSTPSRHQSSGIVRMSGTMAQVCAALDRMALAENQ